MNTAARAALAVTAGVVAGTAVGIAALYLILSLGVCKEVGLPW